MKKSYDIVILDSGVDVAHPDLCKYTDIDCVVFDEQAMALLPSAADVYGHGTAIAGLIKRQQPQACLLSMRIFDLVNGVPKCTEERLVQALRYIDENLNVKVVNMSLDVAEPMLLREMTDVTKRLVDRGVILVAALENTGGITYPACLPWVIGVATDDSRPLPLPMEFYEDSVINIFASQRSLRVPWLYGGYKKVYGASFYCAMVSADAAAFSADGSTGFRQVLQLFREKYPPQMQVRAEKERTAGEKPCFTIRKAALFPFNKEMHSVIRYAEDLTFEIAGVYDVVYAFRVGKTTNEILGRELAKNYLVKNIDEIDWNSFDTLILGCVFELIKLYGDTVWLTRVITDAIARGKNIFAFEDIRMFLPEASSARVYFPSVSKNNLPPFRGKRLYRTAVPIIGVMGTASQQGKFTVQMLLRKEFKKLGCKIGQIGTEPNSLLFGMDYVFANGYNAAVELDQTEQMLYLNDLLFRTCEKLPDIIITGTQKGLLPKTFNNVFHYTPQNYAFLDGIKPDYAILTVSVTDTVEYIRRNIAFLSAFSKTQTLALVLFPVCMLDENNEPGTKKRVLSEAEYEAFRDKINAEIDIPVLFLNNMCLGDRLMQIILAQITGNA